MPASDDSVHKRQRSDQRRPAGALGRRQSRHSHSTCSAFAVASQGRLARGLSSRPCKRLAATRITRPGRLLRRSKGRPSSTRVEALRRTRCVWERITSRRGTHTPGCVPNPASTPPFSTSESWPAKGGGCATFDPGTGKFWGSVPNAASNQKTCSNPSPGASPGRPVQEQDRCRRSRDQALRPVPWDGWGGSG